MNLDLRTDARQHYVHLARDGGPGFHAYVLDRAETLVKEDPSIHDGLVGEIEAAIGPKHAAAARKTLEWFRNPRRRAQ
jgi:hypothetical protein